MKIHILFLLMLCTLCTFSQNGSITIKDNANIILTGNANLIITQPSNQGIIKGGNLQGGIVCDNEQSRIVWGISTNTGNYFIPFKTSNGVQIPFKMNITTSGVGNGKFLISTYHTANDNTPYPQGFGYFSSVINMDYNGVDNSINAVDRFWIINYDNYSTIPTSQFTMTYDAISDLNGILENDLQAQYWDGNSWVLPTVGVSDPSNDNVNSIPHANQNATWVLVNRLSPLPIELYSLYAQCVDNNSVKLEWSTVSETNNDYFALWKSYDGINFESIGQVGGAGNSNSYLEYEFLYNEYNAESTIYYKLQQVDYDGNFSYSDVIYLDCNTENKKYVIIPNPSIDGHFQVYGTTYEDEILVFDMIGNECNKEELEKGCYLISVNNKFIGKLVVN